MQNLFRRLLILAVAVILSLSVCASCMADVFVNQEKPADWEERKILTVIVAETVYNDAFIIQQGQH